MFGYNSSTLNRSLRPATIQRDSNVIAEFEDFLDSMGLLEIDNADFRSTDKLLNFATGFVAPVDVNIDKVLEVGEKILIEMSGQPVTQWKFTKANCVRQMPLKAKALVQHSKSDKKKGQIDTSLCLQRITLKYSTVEEALCYELSSLPPALFSEDGFMRDSGKAKRARDLCNKWGVVVDSVHAVSIVFDGGMLLNHLRKGWKRGDTFLSYAEQVVHHISNAATEDETKISVVMDGYSGVTTKMHIQSKRNPVKSLEIKATKEMTLQTTPEIFTSHPANKQRLVDIVAEAINQSPLSNLEARKADGDADTKIVMTGVELASAGACVIRADDSDILFLCIAQPNTENLFVKRSGLIYDINKTKKNMPPELAQYILVLHGLFGSDTTSGFYKRHSIFSTNWAHLTGQLQVFLDTNSTKEQIQAAGQALVAHRYKCKTPLNLARNKLYREKCSKKTTKKEVNLATLPPTEDACNLHSLRAYRQIQEWMGHVLPPLEFGWQMINGEYHPLPTTQDPAPKSLIDIPQCGCAKSKCSNKQCHCKAKGIFCTDVCTCVGCENRQEETQQEGSLQDPNDSLLDSATEDEGEDEEEDDSEDDVYGDDYDSD